MPNVLTAHRAAAGEPSPAYFRNSGRVDFSGTLVSLVVGLLIGVVMAILYAVAMRALPSEELCCVVCLAFGALLGFIPASLMKRFNVRNGSVTLMVSLLVTAGSYYVAWVVWEACFFRHNVASVAWLLCRHPSVAYQVALAINHDGAWTLGFDHRPVTGMGLAIIWLAEAAVLLGMAIVGTRSVFGTAMFCETCHAWCPIPKTLRTSAWVDPEQLRDMLERRDYGFVPDLRPARGSEYLTFMRQGCPGCGQFNTLTVTARRVRTDRKGRQSSRSRKIVDRLMIDPNDYAHFAPPTSDRPAAASNVTDRVDTDGDDRAS